MASIIPDSIIANIVGNTVNPAADTIKCLLLSRSAAPSKAWAKRSDVTNELATGGGYTVGGFAVTVTVTPDTITHHVDIIYGGQTITSSTLAVGYAVYYKARGGASSADELCFINDLGTTYSTTNSTFTLNASTHRIDNPN